MTVKDFIPMSDVKQTTEKQVKQKPSLEELTTIESPGKPVSAMSLYASKTPKQKRKRKKQTKEPSSITPGGDAILVWKSFKILIFPGISSIAYVQDKCFGRI